MFFRLELLCFGWWWGACHSNCEHITVSVSRSKDFKGRRCDCIICKEKARQLCEGGPQEISYGVTGPQKLLMYHMIVEALIDSHRVASLSCVFRTNASDCLVHEFQIGCHTRGRSQSAARAKYLFIFDLLKCSFTNAISNPTPRRAAFANRRPFHLAIISC